MKISKFLVTTGFAVLMTNGLFSAHLVPDDGLFDLEAVQRTFRSLGDAETETAGVKILAQWHKDRVELIKLRAQHDALYAAARGESTATSSSDGSRALPGAADGISDSFHQLLANAAVSKQYTDPAGCQITTFFENLDGALAQYPETEKFLSSKLPEASRSQSRYTFRTSFGARMEQYKASFSRSLAPGEDIGRFQDSVNDALIAEARSYLLGIANVNEAGCGFGDPLNIKFLATHPEKHGRTATTPPLLGHTLRDFVNAISNKDMWRKSAVDSGSVAPF